VRRFEFSSALQRNAVVVREAGGHPGSGSGSDRYLLYAKGSPEMIRTLVDPASVPEDFDRVLGEYTREVGGGELVGSRM
jgi:magnesium-transporting ATPase (P-type)